MLYTKFTSGLAAQKKLQAGINKLELAAGATLGAKGRLAVVYRINQSPFTTKDGVTVAQEMILEDSDEQAGLLLARGAAQKTAQQAGDGTTATIILTNAIVNEGLKAIEAGANPVAITDGIKKAAKLVVEHIREMAIGIDMNEAGKIAPCQNFGTIPDYLTQVATIAANGDEAIGRIIAEAYRKIGKDGICQMGPPLSEVTEIRVSQGLKVDVGYTDYRYSTNHLKLISELVNPLILIYENKVTDPNHIILKGKILNEIAQTKRPVLFMCDGLDEISVRSVLENFQTKQIQICVTTLPAKGELRKEILDDIAALTGTTVTGVGRGKKIAETTLKDCGEAKKVVVSKDSIIFEAMDGKNEAIEARAEIIRGQIESAKADNTYPIALNDLQVRLARLTSGIATIHVGGITELEMRERAYRVEDAILAAKSAIEEGVVVGGGICLYEAMNVIINKDEIMAKAIWSPFLKLCKNAGADTDKVLSTLHASFKPSIVNTSFEKKVPNIGYNAVTGKIEDLLQAGIVDAAKVVRCSVENATSIACQILLMESLLVQESPEKPR